ELEAVGSLGPRNVIQEIMQRHLETVAEDDSLIQSQEFMPLLVGVASEPETLPCKSPMEGIGQGRAEDRNIAKGKPFAVIHDGLFRRSARQERCSLIAEILQRAAPKKSVFAVRGELVIQACNES